MADACTEMNGTILVVEDDADLRDLAMCMLTGMDFRVLEAQDAPSALRVLEANCQRVDVVFSDICMPPHMNGIELAAEIFRRHPDIKVLLTSGYYANGKSGAIGTAPNGLRVLPKPYSGSQLADAICDVMAKQVTQEESRCASHSRARAIAETR